MPINSKRLVFTEDQARHDDHLDDVATKRDVKELETVLNRDLKEMDTALRHEIELIPDA
ncbi:MAG: hypothetical protein QX199_09945 [Methylococcaceae bacterium]